MLTGSLPLLTALSTKSSLPSGRFFPSSDFDDDDFDDTVDGEEAETETEFASFVPPATAALVRFVLVNLFVNVDDVDDDADAFDILR
jgi:hypothetical protein